jgi:hypothetical protein
MGKLQNLWGHARETRDRMRGDAEWDVTKCLAKWGWKGLVAGGATLVTTLIAIWKWANHLSGPYWFLFFFSVFVLWLMVVTLVVVSISHIRGWWLGTKQRNDEIRNESKVPVEQSPPTPLQKREQNSAEHFAETLHSYQQLLTTLKSQSGNQANVLVAYVNIKHRVLAEKIVSLFTQAEWKTQLYNPPLDTYLPSPTEGIFIYGCNPSLVSTIATALKVAGLSEIEARIDKSDFEQNSPKWDQEQHSLRIRIGYD